MIHTSECEIYCEYDVVETEAVCTAAFEREDEIRRSYQGGRIPEVVGGATRLLSG